MTDDIVERLCRTLSDLPGDDDDLFNEIHAQREEAAKEIKRLRGALERIADTDPDEGTAWFHEVARAALAEEKK
jgi:vacuolar-type H+-ATPase subunit I/STV1